MRSPSATRGPGWPTSSTPHEGEWRLRTGDFRIVYEIHDEILLVLVVAVGHGRKNYRRR